ncbi:putative DNA-binding ribbon-helix-helix protein [Rhodobium orientis]|uniref:Ribbon-helix-helix domain-containing protein n=2 Tax=Rhodobium TaxID=34016 RepID=A0A327JGI9_9HYPH|nr:MULTISPECIES: ribbon-helix-helix domain-containing protein [Rhodobium]MBB4305379.1 putative DNA-binding ribbon-helix-helix protein [Rhodobium orientis]MBK5950087.1 hypothetical protein [Rhodobium orientis]MCW2307005.1 putative DNA-binding ribbon-helix-helix protein [Rhodobium gokarnense]RAI25245.1 hypothetical protein CH339_19050 [Rhodobium orientis]
MQKRSLTINGHRTSLALESEFWDALGDMARQKNVSLSRLIADIDATGAHPNLASAVRCAVLEYYRGHGIGALNAAE